MGKATCSFVIHGVAKPWMLAYSRHSPQRVQKGHMHPQHSVYRNNSQWAESC